MTGTWFNPFTGEFSQPIRQRISQWPSYSMPEGSGFRILIIRTDP